MACALRIGGVRAHALGFEAKSSCSGARGDVESQGWASFPRRRLGNAVTKVCETTSKHGVGAARSALMQAAPLPMRSHETKRRY